MTAPPLPHALATALPEAAALPDRLGFSGGGWWFWVPVSLRCELVAAARPSPIPNVAPWFCGLHNLRGHIVPVVDLSLLPGAAAPAKARHLLVLGQGGTALGLCIDGHPRLLAEQGQPLPALPPLPPQLLPCVSAAYALHGQTWLQARFEPLFKSLGARP